LAPPWTRRARRIRDVEEAADGSLWLLEDANPGGLFRMTPK
jgi:glucose/arabinose dehydrogenase